MTLQAKTNPLSQLLSQKLRLLRVENLRVSFSIQGKELQAVRGISFDLKEGETLAIVGESGSGKSAAVQAITGLTVASRIEGAAFFEEKDLLKEKKAPLGLKIGMVFQDPMTCLNPTMRIGAQIEEGLLYHHLFSPKEAKEKALSYLHLVGIDRPEERYRQYPHQLSGGMRQRVLIAIALICNPKLLIADEPTTALDATIQAQILMLLKSLQERFQMSLILITHDLSVVAQVCDRMIVMYAGKIVEQGSVEEILKNPRHPYTKMLLNARPRRGQTKEEPLQVIEGSPPNLLTPPQGCPFQARCPKKVPICSQEPPFFQTAACWRAIE